MDILYILGTGSVWENNEIRYSLRGVEKNILDKGRVFVIGERPEWIKNVIHIPCRDPYKIKWRNSFYKVTNACKDERLSNDFLLMNDDFFILKPIFAKNYPYYFKGVLTSIKNLNSKKFINSKQITAMILMRQKRTACDFSVHRPIRFNKRKYLEMPVPSIWLTGFSPRSFYCNYYGVNGVKASDINLTPLSNESDFDRLLGDRTDISIFSETAKSSTFRSWIDKKLPKKSCFEK